MKIVFLESVMLENALQKEKTAERVKCIKCKERYATREDQMCDNCRFMQTLENIIEGRKKNS